jgi:hypothetical protein
VVGASVAAGGWVATVVAGACVGAGAAVVAGAPQAASSREDSTSKLAKDHNRDFFFISLSPYSPEYRSDIRNRVFDLEFRSGQTS